MKIKKCPNCGANEDYISNFYDASDLLGLSKDNIKEWYCSKCNTNFDSKEVESWYDLNNLENYSLSQIADIIYSDWKNISSEAELYLRAMSNLSSIQDTYGDDDAESIVRYFLSNAQKWKGQTAKAVKKHLKKLVGLK